MRVHLTRFAHFDKGVLGRMVFPSGLELFTIERPWLDNRSNISCIPAGSYPLEWDMTGRIKEVPRLRDTGHRTQINIHAANLASELQGCIAPGTAWRVEGDTPRVISSGNAMDLLMEQMHPRTEVDKSDLLGIDGTSVILDITDFFTG